jgi:uncharacterized protein
MRIAVVGAGVSGLVAAHLLHGQHELTVFEERRKVGGHTNTIRVDTAYETHYVDTGFIVFNDRNYPNFERLLDRLGVPSQPSQMSFGVSDATGEFEYASTSPNGLFATWCRRASTACSPRCAASSARRVRFCSASARIPRSATGSSATASRASSSSG